MKYFYGKAYYTRSALVIITFGVVRNVWCYLFQTVVNCDDAKAPGKCRPFSAPQIYLLVFITLVTLITIIAPELPSLGCAPNTPRKRMMIKCYFFVLSNCICIICSLQIVL